MKIKVERGYLTINETEKEFKEKTEQQKTKE